MRFEPGQVVVRRCLHPDGRIAALQPAGGTAIRSAIHPLAPDHTLPEVLL